jgi:hypothetical protein
MTESDESRRVQAPAWAGHGAREREAGAVLEERMLNDVSQIAGPRHSSPARIRPRIQFFLPFALSPAAPLASASAHSLHVRPAVSVPALCPRHFCAV